MALKEYRVTWVIDVSAENPRHAAKIAHEMQQEPTTATVFLVAAKGEIKTTTIDLLE
jgi:hypothetical protein